MQFKERMRNLFKPLFIDELVALVPEWVRLQEIRNNSVELHSFLVLYLTWVDIRMPALTHK